jgi:hypothetical protein
MRATKGEMTIVILPERAPMTWYINDFPMPVGIKQRVLEPAMSELIAGSWTSRNTFPPKYLAKMESTSPEAI